MLCILFVLDNDFWCQIVSLSYENYALIEANLGFLSSSDNVCQLQPQYRSLSVEVVQVARARGMDRVVTT